MDKKFTLLAILFFSLIMISCSSNKDSDSNTQQKEAISQVVSGRIIIIGNEPFTKLAVMVNDTTSFVLNASKEIEDELKMNHGENYSITYKEKKKAPEGVAIEVVKATKTNK